MGKRKIGRRGNEKKEKRGKREERKKGREKEGERENGVWRTKEMKTEETREGEKGVVNIP